MGRSFDDKVAAVRKAADDPNVPEHRTLLLRTLSGNNGYLISLAVQAAFRDDTWLSAMLEAFDRLADDGPKRDPQCHGKLAIAKRLYNDDIDAPTLFVSGVSLVQLEPVFGGRQDTAATLRGVCGLALVATHHPRALVHAAELLADPEPAARLCGVEALLASGQQDAAEPLLRLRLATNEQHPEMIGATLKALLEIAPTPSISYAAHKLKDNDAAVADAAALALGESRLAEALPVLLEAADQTIDGPRRRVLLLALALLRSDAAWQHLIELTREGSTDVARDAMAALSTFAHDEELVARCKAALESRGDSELQEHFATLFGR